MVADFRYAGTAGPHQELEARLSELESGTVLSEPETRVKRIEVYVDKNGNQYDEPTGCKAEVTYQRERVYRRQRISEKIEAALADAEEHNVKLGVSAAMRHNAPGEREATDRGRRTRIPAGVGRFVLHRRHRAEHDLLCRHRRVERRAARPRATGLTLVNGYSARSIPERDQRSRGVAPDGVFSTAARARRRPARFDELLRSKRGRQRRNHSVPQRRAREQSDARACDQRLRVRHGIRPQERPDLEVRLPAEQSGRDQPVGVVVFPGRGGLLLHDPERWAEGTYRVWYRTTNLSSTSARPGAQSGPEDCAEDHPVRALRGRRRAERDQTRPTSARIPERRFRGGQGRRLQPPGHWGFGYAETDSARGREQLFEGYYNFQLSEKLRLSFHLTHTLQSPGGGEMSDISCLAFGSRPASRSWRVSGGELWVTQDDLSSRRERRDRRALAGTRRARPTSRSPIRRRS